MSFTLPDQYFYPPTIHLPQIVYVCWLAFEALFIYLYLIETKNVRITFGRYTSYRGTHFFGQRTLEETAALFDGEETVAQLAQEAAKQAGVIPGSDNNSEKDKGSADLHVEHA